MSYIHAADATGEIYEPVAIHIFEHSTFRFFDIHWRSM